MKEGLLHEIELPSHMTIKLHPISHPHRTPTMRKSLGVGWPIREEILNASRISHISSKMDPIRIQFEAGSKQFRKAVNPKLFRTFVPSLI